VGALLLAGILGGMFYAGRASLMRDPWSMAWFVGGTCLFLLLFLVQAEHRRGLRHWLRASREGMEVESRWLFGHKRVLLPARSLQQVEVVRGGESGTWRHAELLVRGEGQQVRVGWHVPVAELRWRARELREAVGLHSGASEGEG
jgi:membrane protein YdbS with pleckstrin-like domain